MTCIADRLSDLELRLKILETTYDFNLIDHPVDQPIPGITIVHPDVVGNAGNGSLAQPFSLEYASTNPGGIITPGHRVLLRGRRKGINVNVSTYKPILRGRPSNNGFELLTNGTPDLPVIWESFPGELAIFQERLDLSGGFTRVIDEVGLQLWETNQPIPSTNNGDFALGYYLWDPNGERKPVLLGCYRGDDSGYTCITGKQFYKHAPNGAGAYYAAPGVRRVPATQKIQFRADPIDKRICYSDLDLYAPASTDPNEILDQLYLYTQYSVYLRIVGSYNVIRNMRFEGKYDGILDVGDCNDIEDCEFLTPFRAITCESDTITNPGRQAGRRAGNDINMMLYLTRMPVARGDVKSSASPVLDLNKGQAIVTGRHFGGKVLRCTMRYGFDFCVPAGEDWEWGSYEGVLPTDDLWTQEEKAFANGNYLLGAMDDAIQAFSSAVNFHFHHNIVEGTGLSLDGSSSNSNWQGEVINDHHNIYDGTKELILQERVGRNFTVQPGTRHLIAAPVGVNDVNIVMAPGEGAALGATPFFATLWQTETPFNPEVIQVTQIVGDVLTVVRAQLPAGGALVAFPAQTYVAGDTLVKNHYDPRNQDEGRHPPNIWPSHQGDLGSADAFRMHHHSYHNTYLWPVVRGFNVGVGHGGHVFGGNATKESGGMTIYANNLIIAGGRENATNTNNAQRRQLYIYGNFTNVFRMTETKIMIDGQAIVVPPYSGPAPVLTQRLIESTGLEHNSSINIIDNISFFQTPQAVADAERYGGYPGGYERQGIQITANVWDAVDTGFRPKLPALQTGAASLHRYGLPGMGFYQPQRGAKLPPRPTGV